MIEKQGTPFPFGGGVDNKISPVHVSPGKFTTLENGIFTTKGAIRKRNGYAAIGSALGAGAGQFVSTFNNELVASDGISLYSRNATSNFWANKGRCQSIGVSRTKINRITDTVRYGGLAINGTLQCSIFVTKSDTTLRYSIKDTSTGQEIVSAKSIAVTVTSTYSHPVVLALGIYFIVIYQTSTNGLAYVAISTATPDTVGGVTAIGADTIRALAAAVADDGTFVWIVSETTGGSGNNVRYAKLTTTLALTTNAGIALGSAADGGINVSAESGSTSAIVMYCLANGDVNYVVVTSAFAGTPALVETLPALSLMVSAAPTSLLAGGPPTSGGTLYYTVQAVGSFPPVIKSCVFSGTTPGTPAILTQGLMLASQVFTYSLQSYFIAYYQRFATVSTFKGGSCYFLVSTATGRPVARIAQEDGALMALVPAPVIASSATGAWRFMVAVMESFVNLVNDGTAIVTQKIGVDDITVDLVNQTNRYQVAKIGDVLHINGGMLQMYDGRSVVEHGFHYSPASVTVAATAGANLTPGVYAYYVTYEWIDYQGNRHRSAPTSATVTITAGANQAANVSVTPLRVTAKTNVRICIYRTASNGSVPTYLDDLANDTTSDGQVYADTTYSDANIAASQQLYTQSAIFNSPGPSTGAMTIYRNRLMLVSSEDPRQIWYSKQVVPGSPVEMNDTFYVALDQLDGVTSAVGVMDDKCILFKAHTAYYMMGTGPDPLGGNNDFSTPMLVNASSGCSNPKSIQMTPHGLMYQSPKGIYMLSRGLEELYLGAEVENSATWSSNPVTGVLLIPSTTEVRFALGETMLVWDYLYKQWSTWTNFAAKSMCSYQGLATFVTGGGQVYQETVGTFTDAGSAIALKLITGWFSLAGLEGWMRLSRIYVLGDFKSSSTLSVKFAVDYDPTIVQTATGAANNPLEWRFNVARQKCQAFQLTIQDTGTSAESFDLTGLAFYWGAKKGLAKLPATRTA